MFYWRGAVFTLRWGLIISVYIKTLYVQCVTSCTLYTCQTERRWQLDDIKTQWRNRANSVQVFLVLVLFKEDEDTHARTHTHVTGFIGRENSEVEKLVHHSLFNVTAFIIYQKSRPSVI